MGKRKRGWKRGCFSHPKTQECLWVESMVRALHPLPPFNVTDPPVGCRRQEASRPSSSLLRLLKAGLCLLLSQQGSRLRVGPVTSLSAGPKRGAWALPVPAPARCGSGGSFCRGPGLLVFAPGAVSAALQAENVECLLLARLGAGSWTWPRKSSLPFLLVLGTMPCRAPFVAISAYARVEMPFFGSLGPALAGS